MAFDRWTPNLSRTARLTTSVVVTLGGALAVLTPWTLPRLSLFPPVVLIFLAAFEMLWQRSASHASEAIKPVAAKDDEPHFS
jgi:hypothetical protein